MISCKTLLHKKTAPLRFLKKDPDEGPVCFQLSGSDPKELALATKIATDYGADLVDLNCGCPVNKIRSRGAGSSLLAKPSLLFELITAMKSATSVPVSIKIRVDGNSKDTNNQEIAKIITEAGADFVTVHGRHWTEHYETPCNYDQIQFFVEELNIPVLGNGDVACLDSLKKMLATGCHGVMLGRAGVGQPWLIGQLMAQIQGLDYKIPTLSERGQMFLRHVTELAELLQSEKFAVIQARKFAKYYARDLGDRVQLIEAVNNCDNLRALKLICENHWSNKN